MTIDTKALEAALLPCPFCGSPAREEAPETRTGMWEIGCPANWSPTRMRDICNAAPAVADMTREATVAAWNRRASPLLEEAARVAEAECPECRRHFMAEPTPAAGFMASCGRRLTRLSECRHDGCRDAIRSLKEKR